MVYIKSKVEDFLTKYNMNSESIDIEENCNVFLKEMENGLNGAKSSLRMIPTYISPDKEITLQEPVIVIDAGGTNFRVAVVTFDINKEPIIENFNIYPMPGSSGKLGKAEFFKTIVSYIHPILHKSNKIGFCFSYPTEILPNGDGRLLQFCKEVQVDGVEGELIGENLLKTIKDTGCKEDKKIVLLNDTAATLLAGKSAYPDKRFDSFIGFILGTGTNTCYIEKSINIGKLKDCKKMENSMLINVESGAYGKAPMGKIDLLVDQKTVNPGQYLFEKMISGGYMGSLMLTVIKMASSSGLFTDTFNQKVETINELNSRDLDDFINYPYNCDNPLSQCCSESNDDHYTLYLLIDQMMKRAAKLITINLASLIIKTGKGVNKFAPVCITAEGTTFYKSKLIRAKVDYYLKKYLSENKNLYYEFAKVDNATLIGTAIAGLIAQPDISK